MRPQGRYLRFRHVFPEVFGPGVQARRGLLRFRWFLLQRVDFRPIWTLGAAAGLGGLLLTVSLFFLQRDSLPAAARVAVSTLPAAPPPAAIASPQIQPAWSPIDESPILRPSGPAIPGPYLQPEFTRLVMPFGWNDRRLTISVSEPQPMDRPAMASILGADGWARARYRGLAPDLSPRFAPYREPPDLAWRNVTPAVRVSDVVPSPSAVVPVSRVSALVEKDAPSHVIGDQPVTYRLVVTNRANTPIPDVAVFEALDVARVMNVEPPARVEPTGLSWRLGGFAPGERRELVVTLSPGGSGVMSTITDVEFTNRVATVVHVDGQTEDPFYQREPANRTAPPPAGLPPFPQEVDLPPFPKAGDLPPFPVLEEKPKPAPSNPAPITKPPAAPQRPSPSSQPPKPPQGRPILKLKAEPPTAIVVGEDATTWYQIENIGDGAANDIVLRLTLPAGLVHHDGRQEVQYMLRRLEPGESRRARLVTRATSHGVYEVSGALVSGDVREPSLVTLVAPETDVEEQPEGEASDWRPSGIAHEADPTNGQCTLVVDKSTGRR